MTKKSSNVQWEEKNPIAFAQYLRIFCMYCYVLLDLGSLHCISIWHKSLKFI